MGKTIVMQQINELRKKAALKENAIKKIIPGQVGESEDLSKT